MKPATARGMGGSIHQINTMKFKLTWILIGSSTFSIVLGFLIGASNSPVLGAALSSLIGIAVALIGLVNKEKNEVVKFEVKNLGIIGKLLFSFSICLFVGVISGEYYRNDAVPFLQEKQYFVWGEHPPKNTYEAFDWVVVTHKLKQLGYTKNQIEELYQIRLKELAQEELANEHPTIPTQQQLDYGYIGRENLYDQVYPFHDVIPNEIMTLKSLNSRGVKSKGIAR